MSFRSLLGLDNADGTRTVGYTPPKKRGGVQHKGDRSFYTDIIRESGLVRNQTKSLMYSLSIARPAEYNQMRYDLIQKVTWDLVRELYDTIYAALDGGVTKDGTSLIRFDGKAADVVGGVAEFRPCLPEAQINEIAYETASILIKVMEDKVVDELMPSNFTKLANEQIQAQVKTKIAGGEYSK